MLDYLKESSIENIDYMGLDLSSTFIDACKAKHPRATFICGDALRDPGVVPTVDYAVMNDDLGRCVEEVCGVLRAERDGDSAALRRRLAPAAALERFHGAG